MDAVAKALSLAALVLLAPALAGAEPKIPYIPGLKIVTAVNQQDGDYESVKTVESIDAISASLRIVADRPVPNPCPTCQKTRRLNCHRTVFRADTDFAHAYAPMYRGGADEKFAGWTALGTSAAVLRELASQGATRFVWTEFVPLNAKAQQRAELKKLFGRSDEGTLKLVERTTLSVLVNGTRVDLPGLRAR